MPPEDLFCLEQQKSFLRRFSVQSLDDLPMLNPEQIEHFKEEAEDEAQLKLDI